MNSSRKFRLGLSAALAVTAFWGQSARGDITQGLIGHWAFDETTGFVANDSTGKGNDGNVSNQVGDTPGWTAGQIGGALSFRGPTDGMDAVIVPNLQGLTNTFSISAWVMADARDGTWPESAIVKSAGVSTWGPLGLVIRLKDRDQDFGPLGSTSVDAGGNVAISDTVGFPVTNWQHVAVVGDGSKIRLYRNGQEVASANYLPPLAAAISPETGIGVSPDDGGAVGAAFWQGKIDDVGIWTAALSAGQIASIFNAGQAGKDLTQADAYQNLPPTITTSPSSISRFVGETASFSVTASGTGTLTYQWKFNGSEIIGATTNVYTIGSVKETDAGQYTVVVSNGGGSKESAAATLTVQKVTIATGLLGYWMFDEKQGDIAADASTNRIDGALANYPGDDSQWVTGQIGGALTFGGADSLQYVSVPDYPKPTSTLTVSCWVWANSLGAWTSFAKNWGSTDAGQFHFGIYQDATHENIYIKQADGKTPNCSDPDPFPTNSWQHVAFVCDGSKVRLYRNGIEVAFAPYDGTLVTPPMSCIGVGVKLANDCGGADTGSGGLFAGKMDDLAIWNRGLNAGEMVAIYQAGLKGKGVLEADTAQVFPPEVTSQTTNVTAFEGKVVSLSVAATGTPPIAYQWLKDGQKIPNATNAALSLGAVQLSAAGTYKVGVTNDGGGVMSSDIVVAVLPRPAATLVSEWKFEENLNDTSGNNNAGTASGAVEYVTGISGKAVRLEAANPIVNDTAVGLPTAGTNSWSFNLWLRLATPAKRLAYLAGFGPVTGTAAGEARGLLAFTGSQDNNIYVWGSSRDLASSTAYPLNRWAMVTVTHDGADNTSSIYLDGQLIAQGAQVLTDIPEGANRITLAPTSNWTVDTAGDFDEYSIWSGVLSPTQISNLYGAGKPKLEVKLSGTSIVITWPAAATGFVLETTANLSGGTWTTVPGVTGNTATIPVGAGNAFFRLRQ